MTAGARQWGILAAAVLACVWLAYSGPGYHDAPSFYSFLALLVLLLPLFLRVFEAAMPGPQARYTALFAVAWYGLNPANVATLTDFTRRPLVWSTLGMVAGLVLYQWRPAWRKFGIYLLPVAAASGCHRVTLAFAPLLLAWVFLCEMNAEWRAFPAALLRCTPGALVSMLSLLLVKAGPSIPGDTLRAGAAGAVRAFLGPFGPTASVAADDWVFILLAVAGVAAALWRETRLVCLGVCWFLFLLAAAPGEPLPACIGLVLAASLVLAKAVERLGGAGRWLVPVVCGCVLIASALASEQRIEALGSSLPFDQTFRSHEPEAWLRVSVLRYKEGRYGDCIAAARTALNLRRDAGAYDNLGVAFAALARWDEVIEAAEQALKLNPDDPVARQNQAWARRQKELHPR
ncbi:MAG: tetratricopeptide repeat protein [Bryobacteraceae bacterium]